MIVPSAALAERKAAAVIVHNEALNVQRRKDEKAVLAYCDCPNRRHRFRSRRQAQVLDQIEVNIPYQFVVAGKTLPAGTYRVKRVGVTDPRLLIVNSLETRATAIIHSTWVENNDADKNEVSFVQVGDEHFLSKIETPNHLFSISVSRSEILEGAANSQNGSSASGSADGNN
jgi:hypothetical protein